MSTPSGRAVRRAVSASEATFRRPAQLAAGPPRRPSNLRMWARTTQSNVINPKVVSDGGGEDNQMGRTNERLTWTEVSSVRCRAGAVSRMLKKVMVLSFERSFSTATGRIQVRISSACAQESVLSDCGLR